MAALRAELAGVKGQLSDYETRLTAIEKTVDEFIAAYERKLDEIARRGSQAKQKAYEELQGLRRDIDAYIDILERSVEAQLDMARRQELRRLLTNARAKRTRIGNVIALKAANNG